MPVPRSVARFNRRFLNRVLVKIAGFLPGFGIMHHVGRRSGRPYRNPVNVFRRHGEYIVALTYGPKSDWVKNVLAAGQAGLQTRGQWVHLCDPRIVTDARHRWAPLPVRLVLHLTRTSQHILLRPCSESGE